MSQHIDWAACELGGEGQRALLAALSSSETPEAAGAVPSGAVAASEQDGAAVEAWELDGPAPCGALLAPAAGPPSAGKSSSLGVACRRAAAGQLQWRYASACMAILCWPPP